MADPAIWDTSRGESIYGDGPAAPVFFTRQRRIPGWMQLHYRMSFDEQGYPMLYVFSGCRAFIRTIPELLFDRRTRRTWTRRQEDHVARRGRYFCMSAYPAPEAGHRSFLCRDDPLNMRTRDMRGHADGSRAAAHGLLCAVSSPAAPSQRFAARNGKVKCNPVRRHVCVAKIASPRRNPPRLTLR